MSDDGLDVVGAALLSQLECSTCQPIAFAQRGRFGEVRVRSMHAPACPSYNGPAVVGADGMLRLQPRGRDAN